MAQWAVKRVLDAAIFASVIGAAGLLASPASAQSDLLGGTGGTAAVSGVSIRDFQLTGSLCPQRDATRVTLTPLVQGTRNARINVAFPTSSPTTSLQVNGPGTRSAACTVTVTLVPTGGRRVEFSILSARENVRFINRNGTGQQLAVRSQFRVGNETSGVTTRQLPAAAQDTAMELAFNNVNLDARTTGTIVVMAALEIQLNNAGNQAAVRIEGANFSFTVTDAGSGQNLLPDDAPATPGSGPAAPGAGPGAPLLGPAVVNPTPTPNPTPGGFAPPGPPSRG